MHSTLWFSIHEAKKKKKKKKKNKNVSGNMPEKNGSIGRDFFFFFFFFFEGSLTM